MNKCINKTFKVTLTPITPIHIGNGENIFPYDYIVKDDFVYIINMDNLFNKLSSLDKKRFLTELKEGLVPLRTFISSIYKEEYGFDHKLKSCNSFIKLYNQKLKASTKNNENNALEINDFINSILGYYIPGSSLKGALRSAFIYSNLKEKNICSYKLKRDKKRITLENNRDKFKADEYEENVLNSNRVNTNPFKAIKISDSNFFNNLNVYEATRVAYKKKNNEFEKQITSYMLATQSKYSTGNDININFTMNIFSGFYEYKNTSLKFELKDFIKALKVKYTDLINEELKFYNNKLLEPMNLYENLLNLQNELGEKEALIRLGSGTGFYNTSLALINKERDDKTNPVSRILCNEKYPLGWAVVKFNE